VGHKRAHTQLLGQGQGLLVVDFGRHGIGGIGVGMDNTELVQRQRLVPAFLLLPGQVKRLARVLPSDKARQSPHGRRLQASPEGAGPHQFKHLDRLWQPFDGHGPQGSNAHQPLD
jgi:hypothetical protein